jgi:hypothetical protein
VECGRQRAALSGSGPTWADDELRGREGTSASQRYRQSLQGPGTRGVEADVVTWEVTEREWRVGENAMRRIVCDADDAYARAEMEARRKERRRHFPFARPKTMFWHCPRASLHNRMPLFGLSVGS